MQSLPHQFLTFCREKPAEEAYDYIGTCAPCALHQFLITSGYPVRSVGGLKWTDVDFGHHPIPLLLAGDQCNPGALAQFPHTFGALADRLEAALAETR